MIRTKGEAGTGDVSQAVDHMRSIMGEIAYVKSAKSDELYALAKEMGVSYDLLVYVHENGKLPVANFSPAASPPRRCRPYAPPRCRRRLCGKRDL